MSYHRCPATHQIIQQGEWKGSLRCVKPCHHPDAHLTATDQRWRFGEDSYSGLTDDHADYWEKVEDE